MSATKNYSALAIGTSPVDLDIPEIDQAHDQATWLFAFTGDHDEDLKLLDEDGNTIQTIPANELLSFGGVGKAVSKPFVPTKIKAAASTTATFAIHRVQ